MAVNERDEMTVKSLTEQFSRACTILDAKGFQTISKEEFHAVLEKQEAAMALTECAVDVVDFLAHWDFLIEAAGKTDIVDPPNSRNEREVSMSDRKDAILQLRGTNIATVCDMVEFQKWCTAELSTVSAKLIASEKRVNAKKGCPNVAECLQGSASVATGTSACGEKRRFELMEVPSNHRSSRLWFSRPFFASTPSTASVLAEGRQFISRFATAP